MLARSDSYTVPESLVGGSGDLIKQGPGTATLSTTGAMGLAGFTRILQGTLAYTCTGDWASQIVMSSNTTLDLTNASGGAAGIGSLADAVGSVTGHQVLLGTTSLTLGTDQRTRSSPALSLGAARM